MSRLRNKSLSEIIGQSILLAPMADSRWALPSCYIGVEVEAERVQLLDSRRIERALWEIKTDGSLHDNGREFVFEKPLMGVDVSTAIDTLFDEENPTVQYELTPRAGVHVHINWRDNATMESLYKLITIVYCIEPAIFEIADPGRKWCGWCSPITELNTSSLRDMMTTDSAARVLRILGGEGISGRYYGLNLMSLSRFGTVEFRYFPSTDSKERIEEWINLCMLLKKAATTSEESHTQLASKLATREGILEFVTSMFDFNGIAEKIIAGLDIEQAIERMADLEQIVSIAPSTLSQEGLGSKAAVAYMSRMWPEYGQMKAKQEADIRMFNELLETPADQRTMEDFRFLYQTTTTA